MATNLESISIAETADHKTSSLDRKGRRFYGYVSRIRKQTKLRLKTFDSLEALDPDTRRKIRRQVSCHLAIFTAFSERQAESLIPFLLIIWIPMLCFVFGAPLIVNTQLKISHSFWSWVVEYILYWLALMGIFALAFWPEWIKTKKSSINYKKDMHSLLLAFTWTICVSILYVVALVQLEARVSVGHANLFLHAVISGLFAYLCLFAFVALATLVSAIFFYMEDRQTNRRHPDTMVIVELFNILYQVEKHPGRWTKLNFKRDLMHRLERIALRIEHDLPRRLRSGDDITDDWLKKTTLGMATAIREKKKWILTPKPDSRERLMESLKNNFVSAVTHNWDGFEKAEPRQITSRQFVSRLGDLLAAFLRGALPLAILWIVQQTPLALQDRAADYAMLVALGWLVISLLFKLDPLAGEKLDALKKVRDLLAIK